MAEVSKQGRIYWQARGAETSSVRKKCYIADVFDLGDQANCSRERYSFRSWLISRQFFFVSETVTKLTTRRGAPARRAWVCAGAGRRGAAA